MRCFTATLALAGLALAMAGCPQQKQGPSKQDISSGWAAADAELRARLEVVQPRLRVLVKGERPEAVELLNALDGAQNEFHKTHVTVGLEMEALPVMTEEALQPLSARFTAAQGKLERFIERAEVLTAPPLPGKGPREPETEETREDVKAE
jgi:hypothetical protein